MLYTVEKDRSSIGFILLGITLLIVPFLVTAKIEARESKACELATEEATWIHWQYVEGNATLRDSYNARDYMRKICNLKEQK